MVALTSYTKAELSEIYPDLPFRYFLGKPLGTSRLPKVIAENGAWIEANGGAFFKREDVV